jgi:hypothetical protein
VSFSCAVVNQEAADSVETRIEDPQNHEAQNHEERRIRRRRSVRLSPFSFLSS